MLTSLALFGGAVCLLAWWFQPPVWQPKCSFATEIPMYYLNLDRSPERRNYMKQVFGCGGQLVRVRGIDGLNDDVQKYVTLRNNTFQEFLSEAKCSPAELSLTASHIKAIKKARDDLAKVALFLEDDASPILSPLWVQSLDDAVAEANNKFPNWKMIRFQYSISDGRQRAKMRSALREVPNTLFGRETFNAYGMVAYALSERGIKHVLDTFVDDNDKLDCLNQPRRCVADFCLTAGMGRHAVLEASPAYFVTRFFEDSTGVRGKKERRVNDQYRLHYIFLLESVQDMVEYAEQEAMRRALNLKPEKFFIRVENATLVPSMNWVASGL